MPREFVVATQRERLLDAVSQVVAQAGYHSATVTEIVAAAGTSTKTFYEHFADKEECFLAAYDLGIEILYSHVRAAYEEQAPWPHKIRAGIEILLGLLAAEPAFARLCVVEISAAGPRGVERRQAALASFGAFFDDHDDSRGGPWPERATVIQAVVGGIYECIYAAVVDDRAADLTSVAGPLVYMALLPFVGAAKARAVSQRARGIPAPPRTVPGTVRAKRPSASR